MKVYAILAAALLIFVAVLFAIDRRAHHVAYDEFGREVHDVSRYYDRSGPEEDWRYWAGYMLDRGKQEVRHYGRLELAELDLKEAIKIDPELSPAYEALGELYLVMAKNPKTSPAESDVAALKEAARTNFLISAGIDGNYRAYTELASFALADRKPELAYEYLSRAVEKLDYSLKISEITVFNRKPYYNRGRIAINYLLDGRLRLDTAESDFRRILEYFPEDEQTRLRLGRVLFYKGDLAGAKDVFDETNPVFARSLRRLIASREKTVTGAQIPSAALKSLSSGDFVDLSALGRPAVVVFVRTWQASQSESYRSRLIALLDGIEIGNLFIVGAGQVGEWHAGLIALGRKAELLTDDDSSRPGLVRIGMLDDLYGKDTPFAAVLALDGDGVLRFRKIWFHPLQIPDAADISEAARTVSGE